MGRINHIPTGMQIQVVKVNAFLIRSLYPIVKDRSHIIVDAISVDFGCLGQPPIPFLFLLDTQVL